MSRDDRAGGFATALFRAALLAQPRATRVEWGEEMVWAFRAGLAERRGLLARARWTARCAFDGLWSGLRERRRVEGHPDPDPAREGRRMSMFSDLRMDLKVAGRSLRRAPGFTLAAVAILALGIGANTALYSAIRGALLTPPPFPEPDRIVLLDLTETDGGPEAEPFPWSYPKFRVLSEAELPLEASGAYSVRNLTLTGAGDATVVPVEIATPDYFEVLRARPVRGRAFAATDDTEGAALVALLSHAEWEGRFGSDPAVIGRDIQLAGRAVTVIGVMPPGFRGLSGQGRLWVTPHAAGTLIRSFLVTGTEVHWLQGVGRLRAEASLAALDEAMRGVGRAADAAGPGADDPDAVREGAARALLDVRVGERVRRSLLVLALASVLLLGVACANLGGLMVARAAARSRESAVRAALGAGWWRVARGRIVEGLIVALLAGVASTAVAGLAGGWIARAWPRRSLSDAWNVDVVGLGGVTLEGSELLFAAVTSIAVGFLLGLVPALSSRRAALSDQLREGATATLGRGRRRPWRGGLVAAEVAVALVLIVGAGLLLRSLHALGQVERGYVAGGLLTFDVRMPPVSAWADDPADFHEQVEARIGSLPGVESIGMGCVAPVSGHCMLTGVQAAGDREWPEGSRPEIGVHYVTDGWFHTLGVPMVSGRGFTSADRADSPLVVVLGETAARRLFPEGDALGSTVEAGFGDQPAEVIGIVGDVLYERPEYGHMAEVYLSHRQADGYGTFLLRTRDDPLALVPAIRAAVRELEPDAPVVSPRTLTSIEASASADTRMLGGLLLAYAGLALLLACTGVWAAVAFTVSRRLREFGLRLALGAAPGRVVGAIVGGGLRVVLAGIALGGVSAWFAARLLDTLLFGVGVGDPLVFGAGAVLLLAVALLAAWLPARRAVRVDPVQSLRAE
ncbi:ADOP family duplicated permease [Gemmatimonadota bacterium Y43]|uniref:ADOP family duplicated permease n=1 Tax=Gaopeijia maritima TaxID=3119007 RepID=UPI003295F123